VSDKHQVRLRVNGTEHELLVEARRTLADMLRHDLGYTGTNVGCEHGICGACTVRLDGAPVRSCLVFGVQADGAEVRTVEGLADGDELSDLQQAFRDHHALQCGFCTPGFLMLAEAYFAERGLVQPVALPGRPASGAASKRPAGPAGNGAPADGRAGPDGAGPDGAGPDGAGPDEAGPDEAGPDEAEIRELVASNLCRCTGYQGIVAAMLATARSRRAASDQARP
jgi:aerobic-type carbon monoxide dehydrogenase small subunit (CoxS/CutS family)